MFRKYNSINRSGYNRTQPGYPSKQHVINQKRRNTGHLKIWKDQLHIEVLGTGTMPVHSEFMIMKWK
jgi:hypothetical protein